MLVAARSDKRETANTDWDTDKSGDSLDQDIIAALDHLITAAGRSGCTSGDGENGGERGGGEEESGELHFDLKVWEKVKLEV